MRFRLLRKWSRCGAASTRPRSPKCAISVRNGQRAVADRYALSLQYGRAVEGWQRSQEDLRVALGACRDSGRDPDHDAEVRACAQDARDWSQLIAAQPMFVGAGA